MKKLFLFLLVSALIISSSIFVDMVSAETGMLVFQNSTTAFIKTPQYRIWNETGFSLSNMNITPLTGTLLWTILRNNPIRQELILGALDNSSNIDVYFYNSTRNWTQAYVMTLVSSVNLTRAFDVQIERISGDVLVAYNNGTAGIIGYQIWNGTDWYKSGNLTTNLTGRVNWIKMASYRYNNDIMLIAADNNSRLIGMEWNGSTWTTSYLLETVIETPNKECFDVAYENSGDALIVWANASLTAARYIAYSNNSWGVRANAPASSGQTADFQWLRLENYPNTDRIMFCSVDAGADYNCAEWTGTGWGSVTEITAAGEYSDTFSYRNFDIISDTSSNSFVFMYGLNNVDYYNIIRCFGTANCQAGVWETTQTILSGVDIGWDTSWTSLYYDPENVGKITAVMGEQNNTATGISGRYIARLSCTNSPNSCAADQISALFSIASNRSFESAMFVYEGRKPTIQNITTSASIPQATLLTISANGVNDTNNNTLDFYCSISSNLPTSSNTICTGGNTIVNSPYTSTNCSFTSQSVDGTYTVYCRVYDEDLYSTTVNTSYVISSSAPTTSIVSVAGDTTPSYYDTINDAIVNILVSGEAGMTCRWATTDLAYSEMSNPCATNGIQAECNVTGVSSEGFYTRYVSCANSLGTGQSSSNNLNVQFYLDYTAPTTSDSSNTNVHAPNYVVNITEGDAVDADPVTKYCTSSSLGCSPTTSIDNGGQVVYSSSNRGANYLRYYSTDFAGNVQIAVNKTININQLPTFSSAADNATTIKGGASVNILTNSSDVDSSQTISLFVCNTSGATSSGCSGETYCTATGAANLSCSFVSESDSASHVWYAYIFDELGESASSNPLTGSYTTDTTPSVITLNNPSNGSTITQNSVTITITINEPLANAWYSLNGNTNVSMSNSSLYVYTHSNTTISDGHYNLTIWTNDSYQNIGSLSGNSFTINTVTGDATPPVITIVSPGNLSYNNPNSFLINITANENLNWAGYKINYGTLANLSNSTLQNWNKTVTGLSQEAIYNLTVFANDTSNNQANKTIIIYTDSSSPRYSSVSVTPASSNVSQNVNCSISWTDGFNITNLKISENSLGSHENHTITFSGKTGTASYLILGAKLSVPGAYTCIFYAEDLAGNVNSTSTTFTVSDVTAPVLTILSPSNLTYNTNSIDISVLTSEIASSAWYSLDNAANVTMGNTSSTSWNKTITSLAEGSHNITFYANDTSNNVGNSSRRYFSVNTGAADTIPPVITINTLSNATYYTNTTLSLNITTNENTISARYILNSGSSVMMSNSSLTKWNATLSGLGNESTNILEIYSNDTSNNKGNTNITFYVDTLAPRFSNVSAIPASANVSQNVVCNANITDGFNFGYVKISENSTISGVFLNHTIDLSSSGYANYTILNVQKGTYTCTFYATDTAGNANSTNVSFVVSDVTAPVISINSPLNQVYSTNSILLSITLDENITDANYSLDGGFTNISLTGSGKSWSETVSLSDGNHSVIFYAVDSSGNLRTSSVNFSTDITVYDTTPPLITIWSPVNNTYYTNGTSLLLNISADESLSWAGYRNTSGALTNLSNTSVRNWNATIDLEEGNYNITFYANDSSSNKNSANTSITIHVDLNNPSIGSFNCTNPANDSQNVICNASVSDTIGLSYYILGNNATGSWINSSQISLNESSRLNYTIGAGNTTPGSFGAELYLYDLSGRTNMSLYIVNVTDDKTPEIYNITYLPNTTLELDPSVVVNVNATIVENYNISSVLLMLMNLTDGVWEPITMNNNSAITNLGNSNVIYNASFIPKNGTYIFRINATDSAGNHNISANYTLVVENDTSFWNSTTIPDTKSFTILQAAENNSLGILYLNNTGDNALNFNITLVSSSLGTRLSINYTLNQTMSYSVSSGKNLSLSIEVNTTSLVSSTYKYNVTVSSAAGTTVFSKQLSIQALAAPYIVTSITKYSSSVTKGQTDIELISSVSNYGTQDASDVYLNWSLPSSFSLTSGSLSRNLGNLPIGSSSTNTITFSVASSAADSVVNIIANATATGDLSASDYKEITIGSPITIVVTVPGASGAGTVGGGAAGGGKRVYNKEIEVVRGKENIFDIEIHNLYGNSKLEDLTIKLTGFLEQYISISPKSISSIGYNETKAFTVKLSAPSYKDYEEYDLQAVITGKINNGKSISDYSETQWIKVTIQEISKEEVQKKLDEAKNAISDMKRAKFNTVQVEKILADADNWLNEKKYKQSEDLSDSIVKIKETAFEADDLLRRVIESMQKPSKNNLIVGNIISNLGSYDTQTPLKNLLTGKTIFASSSTEDIVNLGIAAFERGDFTSALERANQARETLILERKGNFLLFVYLYWYYILLVMLLVSGTGIAGYRKYQKTNITKKIQDLNNKENTVRSLILKEQEKYYSKSISAGEYKRLVNHHQEELAELKKLRGILGNTRIKMLKPQQVSQDLKKENKEVEEEIKKIQGQFYKDKKISESEYKTQFEAMNDRLAEIEEEKTTLELLNGKDTENRTIRKILSSIKEVPKNIIKKIKGTDKRGIMMVDNKIVETLKKHAKNKDCKKKWVKLNLKKNK